MGVIKRSGRWYVKWKDASGRWVRKATTARTKAEALLLWHSYAEQAQRQRDGLAPRAVNSRDTLFGLAMWWVENKCPAPSKPNARGSLRAILSQHPIGALPLMAVTADQLDGFFAELLTNGFKPSSVSNYRGLIRRVFNAARRAGKWNGISPTTDSIAISVPKVTRETLGAAEVRRLLEHTPDAWRPFFALAIYLGLRKGEICGLRKTDYDPVRQTLFIGRNYGADITKTKRSDTLPVSSELAKYLQVAMKTKGAGLCPHPSGDQRTRFAAPEKTLRWSMKRAGIITGYVHKCRGCTRHGETTHIEATDADLRRCPKCNTVMWPAASVKDLRFHDLRHTCATLLLKSGAPIQHVQRVMRHSSITTTINTYGHLVSEDLRPMLELLGTGPRPVQTPSQQTHSA
jgi:integrase